MKPFILAGIVIGKGKGTGYQHAWLLDILYLVRNSLK